MERNIKLDYLRVVLSLLVITPHIQPLFDEDSLLGWLISNGIARIAVPCFFIISGYFAYLKLDDKKAMKKYLIHLLIVYFVWSLIYLPTYFHTIETRSLVTFAFMGYYHLWFLPALIIGILMLVVLRKILKNDLLILIIGIFLYACGYVMENAELPYRSFYNGVFFGYPFIALGYYIRKKGNIESMKAGYLLLFLSISFITLLLESYVGYKNIIYHNIFLSLYILCPMLIIGVLKSSKSEPRTNDISKFAAGIYYVHILVIAVVIPLSETDNIYKYPLIAAVSILLSIFIVFINKRIKILL